jgi:hypothetical protein
MNPILLGDGVILSEINPTKVYGVEFHGNSQYRFYFNTRAEGVDAKAMLEKIAFSHFGDVKWTYQVKIFEFASLYLCGLWVQCTAPDTNPRFI